MMPRRYEGRHVRGGGRKDRHAVDSKSVRLPAEDGPALLDFFDAWGRANTMSTNAAMVEALREFRRNHTADLAAEAPTMVLSAAPASEYTEPTTLVAARVVDPDDEEGR